MSDKYELAGLIAGVVHAVPGVAHLDGGLGRVVTFGPGKAIAGVAVRDEAITVRVVIEPRVSVTEIDTSVRAAVAPHSRGQLNLEVADIADQSDEEEVVEERA